MEIRMARGDMETRTILLKNSSGTAYSTVPDEIYFTVKKNANDHDYLFQKRLDSGIVMIETGKYQLVIMPTDTDGLAFGTYDCDFEIIKEGEIKKTFVGTLVIAKEVTHHYNEAVI